jgi:hypothetical protein
MLKIHIFFEVLDGGITIIRNAGKSLASDMT